MKIKIKILELPSTHKGLCDAFGQIAGPFKDLNIERKKPKPKVHTRQVMYENQN